MAGNGSRMRVSRSHDENGPTAMVEDAGDDAPDATAYNYDRFDVYVEDGRERREFEAFPNLLHAGDPAPEIDGLLLNTGGRITLSHIWRKRTVVIEFGSFT